MILTGGPLGAINLRGAIAQTLEPETVTYFAAMDAASESYWPSEVALIDTLIKQLKADAVWAIPTLLWFPVGETIGGATRYVKHPQGVGFKGGNVGFAQAQWDRLIGLDGRGTVLRYLDTQTTEFDYVPSTNTHMMVCCESDIITNDHRDIGNITRDSFQLIVKYVNNLSYYRSFSSGTAIENGSGILVTDRGVILASRKSELAKQWVNANQVASGGSSTDTAPLSGTIAIFTAASFGERSNKILSAASIGKGFEPAQYQLYQAALNAARTARAALTPP